MNENYLRGLWILFVLIIIISGVLCVVYIMIPDEPNVSYKLANAGCTKEDIPDWYHIDNNYRIGCCNDCRAIQKEYGKLEVLPDSSKEVYMFGNRGGAGKDFVCHCDDSSVLWKYSGGHKYDGKGNSI